MKLYSGIDLHANNHLLTIIDEEDKRVFQKRLPNDLVRTLKVLEPFKSRLQGIAVESTFNWYWLVDGLMQADYPVELVNPAAVKQYEGLKATDDKYDAFYLAHLMRLGILPTGYIYPKADRGVRDLLRKRMQLVQHRTRHVLSAQNQVWRSTGAKLKGDVIKRHPEEALSGIADPNLVLAITANLALVQNLNGLIDEVEQTVLNQVRLRPTFKTLLSVFGIGKILALTIMLETGDIGRFPKVGDFASYCRCVDSKKTSNGKKKGEGNTKNGNKYLAWAFIEAAHYATRFYEPARRFYQRKCSQRNSIVAKKALAHKLARASYYVMRDQVAFKPERLFS